MEGNARIVFWLVSWYTRDDACRFVLFPLFGAGMPNGGATSPGMEVKHHDKDRMPTSKDRQSRAQNHPCKDTRPVYTQTDPQAL